MRNVIKKARRDKLPIDLQFDLFDKMVIPVILYDWDIWGYQNLGTMENLHLNYVKKIMINFWSIIACGNRNKLSFIMYNLCK